MIFLVRSAHRECEEFPEWKMNFKLSDSRSHGTRFCSALKILIQVRTLHTVAHSHTSLYRTVRALLTDPWMKDLTNFVVPYRIRMWRREAGRTSLEGAPNKTCLLKSLQNFYSCKRYDCIKHFMFS